MSTASVCHQVNLQTSLGGGEIYTRFFSRALAQLGWRSVLYVARGATYWDSLGVPADRVEVAGDQQLYDLLPRHRSVIVTHTLASETLSRALAERHWLGGFAHMPLYDREPRGFVHYRRILGVSQHVIDSARSKGLSNLHDEPLYGVADLSPRGPSARLEARSPYDWDRRKLRDRLLSLAERAVPRAFASGERYERIGRALSIGIVSRLTPIKQLPLLFRMLAPVIARFPRVRLEVFGAGGYASVRDLKAALAPCRAQVRFWGHQPDVKAVYPRVDYVLSGLPEKEALGLNLIEAQASGTPVLAVNKPPFTETVVHGRSGYLFDDPRDDGGVDFERLLKRIEAAPRPDPREHHSHLAQFSETAFRERVARAMASLS